MYGLLITFRTTIDFEQLEEPFTDYAHELREMPGLVSKAWLHDGDTVGGFHLFVDRSTAEAYVASDLAAGLRATDGFDDFEARGFEVLDGLSALTGISESVPIHAR